MVEESKKTIARSSLLLQSLPEQHFEHLCARSVWKSYDRGASLFLQGEPADSIHLVIDGWIKIFRIASSGNEAVVSVFTRGESFGEAVALRRRAYPVSAEAVSACEVMHIPASTLIEIMRQDPDVSISVLAATFAHLQSLVSQLEQLKAQTGAQRVARFLLDLCDADCGSCVVTLPYDKVLIAGRLGMKPESLSRAFSKLQSIGVKVSGNHAAIHDTRSLQDFLELDPARSWTKAL